LRWHAVLQPARKSRGAPGVHDLWWSASRWLLKPFEYLGQLAGMSAEALGYLARGGIRYRQMMDQLAQTGFSSLPLVIITMVFTGMVMAFHLGQQGWRFGAGGVVGWLTAETICRELGPVLASVVVAARVGSAITAEIGTMKVTEQIDALRALATSPIEYLVVPRVIACMIMVPSLTAVGDAAGIAGGYVYAVSDPRMGGAAFLSSIDRSLDFSTAVAGVGKAFFFGLIIALVACHQGLFCGKAAEEVGRATTRSVVFAILAIYASDYFLSRLLFLPK
jgi:phospholipid/cholesterol/gamma-HCH transport system permease protein